MKRNILSIIWIVVLLAFASGAQASTSSTSATATIVAPLSLGLARDLDFGTIIPGATQGTVSVNPATGARTPAGGVTLVNSIYGAALFNITGTKSKSYTIKFSSGNVTIRNTANTNIRMTVNLLTSDLPANGNGTYRGTYDATGKASFHVGGTLTVAANQTPGSYTGIYNVEVNYD